MFSKSINMVLIPLLVAAAGLSSCATRKFGQDGRTQSALQSQVSWDEYSQEQSIHLKNYVESKTVKGLLPGDTAFNWFQNFPLGYAGVPLLLLKALTKVEVKPGDSENLKSAIQKIQDIFGSENDLLRPLGFGMRPPADLKAEHAQALPLGMGYTHSDIFNQNLENNKTEKKPPLLLGAITCGACHVGRVKLRQSEVAEWERSNWKPFGYGPDLKDGKEEGKSIYLVGAPNTQFDSSHFRHGIERFVLVMKALKGSGSKPSGDYTQLVARLGKTIQDFKVSDVLGSGSDPKDQDAATSRLKWISHLKERVTDVTETVANAALLEADQAVYKSKLTDILEGLYKKIDGRMQLNVNLTHMGYEDDTESTREGSAKNLELRKNGRTKISLNGGTPGQLDAFNLANSVLIDVKSAAAEIRSQGEAPSPAVSDIMSTWTQNLRPVGNWNGNMEDHFYRNLGASFGGVADATKVDPVNTHISTEFLLRLPSPTYPFEVNTTLATAGKEVFIAHCSKCHGTFDHNNAKNDTTFGWESSQVQNPPVRLNVGTDMTRANAQPQSSIIAMRAGLKAGCRLDGANFFRMAKNATLRYVQEFCEQEDSKVAGDFETISQGYIPLNLTGIWARAPYLHNGSVPTLYDLLAGDESTRPKEFWRGIPYYNAEKVGFVSTDEELMALYKTEVLKDPSAPVNDTEAIEHWLKEFPTAAKYTVDRTTRSNAGHYNMSLGENNQVLPGAGWPKSGSEEFNALLEYLKTL